MCGKHREEELPRDQGLTILSTANLLFHSHIPVITQMKGQFNLCILTEAPNPALKRDKELLAYKESNVSPNT